MIQQKVKKWLNKKQQHLPWFKRTAVHLTRLPNFWTPFTDSFTSWKWTPFVHSFTFRERLRPCAGAWWTAFTNREWMHEQRSFSCCERISERCSKIWWTSQMNGSSFEPRCCCFLFNHFFTFCCIIVVNYYCLMQMQLMQFSCWFNNN